MKRIVLIFTIVLILLSSFTACGKERQKMSINISPSNKKIAELVRKKYSTEDLNYIISFTGTIQELCSIYPAECVREIDNGYRISYLGNSNASVLVFDRSGNYLFGNLYHLALAKSDFDVLSKGSTLEDSMRIDPNGNYLFLYTGTNNIERQSYHCTTDGYFITIKYDDNYLILSVSAELI